MPKCIPLVAGLYPVECANSFGTNEMCDRLKHEVLTEFHVVTSFIVVYNDNA